MQPSVLPGAIPCVADHDVRQALDRISASPSFQRSPQLQRLLKFLVDESLAGRSERLKEYVIGLEVFGRPPRYDPRLDSLVRVEVHRLRVALAAYYRNDGSHDTLLIDIPKGSYHPVVRPCECPDRRGEFDFDLADPPNGGVATTSTQSLSVIIGLSRTAAILLAVGGLALILLMMFFVYKLGSREGTIIDDLKRSGQSTSALLSS